MATEGLQCLHRKPIARRHGVLGDQHALSSGAEVFVAHERQVAARHGEGGSSLRVSVHDGSQFGHRHVQAGVQWHLAGGFARADVRAVAEVDQGMVARLEVFVQHPSGAHHHMIGVYTHAHIAGRTHHQTLRQQPQARVVHLLLCGGHG